MENATEPGAGVVKRDRSEGSNEWRLGLRPGLPEWFVICMVVQEDSEFANVMDNPFAKKNIAQNVKGEIGKVVDGT
jgi:hypothetical protein